MLPFYYQRDVERKTPKVRVAQHDAGRALSMLYQQV